MKNMCQYASEIVCSYINSLLYLFMCIIYPDFCRIDCDNHCLLIKILRTKFTFQSLLRIFFTFYKAMCHTNVS